MAASCAYLSHLRDAWNHQIAGKVAADRLEQQDVYLTVPASFDAVARELTVEAARAAGLEKVTLLEEPQAAFYAWLAARGDAWRKQVKVGDILLVCDVGGGTTDFTLIAVTEQAGELMLTRQAVGEHILLGGDNMDLALAHAVASTLPGGMDGLDASQRIALGYACRSAKEVALLGPEEGERPGLGAGTGLQGHRRVGQDRADTRRRQERITGWILAQDLRPPTCPREVDGSGSRKLACRTRRIPP